MDSREAHFDPKTARFTHGENNQISFADPTTARAAGYTVAPRPDPLVGVVTVASGESVSVLRRPTVICAVVGTEHRPAPSGAPPEAEPARRRQPRARRRA